MREIGLEERERERRRGWVGRTRVEGIKRALLPFSTWTITLAGFALLGMQV